jgi:IclR family KDG regulon transcriptional repressor
MEPGATRARKRRPPVVQAPPNVVPGAQSIVKAMMLLELFSTEHAELSVAEAAGELDIPRSSAHRLLAVLAQRGLLRQDRPGGPYALGPRVVALAAAYRASQPLSAVALPHLKALLAEVDQTVNLYVRLNDTRIVIERLESSHALQLIRRGDPLPIGHGAAGRILALSDAAAREAGVIVTRGDRVPGACGIAAAIFSHTGAVVAALDVSGPADRFDARTTQLCKRAVLRTARLISLDLGDPGTDERSARSSPRERGTSKRIVP